MAFLSDWLWGPPERVFRNIFHHQTRALLAKKTRASFRARTTLHRIPFLEINYLKSTNHKRIVISQVGVIEDSGIKEDLAPLLRFWSSKSGDAHRSLDAYVGGMAANQSQVKAERSFTNVPKR